MHFDETSQLTREQLEFLRTSISDPFSDVGKLRIRKPHKFRMISKTIQQSIERYGIPGEFGDNFMTKEGDNVDMLKKEKNKFLDYFI